MGISTRSLNTIEISTAPEDYERARAFVDDLLKRNGITGAKNNEVMLIFEALYHDITEQLSESGSKAGQVAVKRSAGAAIRISVQKSLGEVRIVIGYAGRPFVAENDAGDELTPEGRVLRAFADRIDCSFHSGYNNISIWVRRSPLRSIMFCGIAMIAAAVVYSVIHFITGAATEQYIVKNVVEPFEGLFANALLMIAGPVTFFSLLKNLTDVYVFSSEVSNPRKVQALTMLTSIISVILALLVTIPAALFVRDKIDILDGYMILDLGKIHLDEILRSILPADIVSIFQTVSPFPMVITAVIMTFALCSSGRYFDSIKRATNACYALFSSMLALIMFALPLFAFASFLDLLLSNGPMVLVYVIQPTLFILATLIVMAVFYAVRLKLAGIAVMPFVRKLKDFVIENIKINSAIDAVPFNIRYCMRKYNMRRKTLEESMPILAQINLDGNCFVLTVITILIMMISGTPLSFQNVAAVSVLVFFLSMGAPNQPGSVLVGLLMLMTFLHLDDLVPVAIYCEVVFGSLLNMINVLGDLVTVAILDKKGTTG